MANIYTRKAVKAVLDEENLTPEERTERLMALYGQALDDGYVSKSQAQAAQNAAIEQARADAIKGVQTPDPKESDEYKALLSERDMLRAIGGEDFATVKPKFRETVFKMLDRSERAASVADQLKGIGEQFEEYFTPKDNGGGSGQQQQQQQNTPVYSRQQGRTGTNPTSEEDNLFKELSKSWGS